MLFVLFTALMALYAAYSANIVVLLQAPSDSIRNLPQLAAAKITLAANDVDYNHFVFVSHFYDIPYKNIIHLTYHLAANSIASPASYFRPILRNYSYRLQ